jgi:hypothetical protein
VPYREDLEAALAHSAAAEEQLANARDENAHDHERIVELERQLAEARAGVVAAESANPAPPSTPPAPTPAASTRPTWFTPWLLLPLAIVLVVVSDAAVKYKRRNGQVTRASKIDVMAELARAESDARKLMPDAALLQLESQSVGMVDARGDADLTKGYMTFDFYSPSRKRYVHVLFMQGGERQVTELNSLSGLRVHDPPRCTVADVWAEAIRRGAPASSLAEIRLRSIGDGPAWTFNLGPNGQTFSMTLPDECSSQR